jgi:putative transposase
VRAECLNQHWFLDLGDARARVEAWRTDHDEVGPHGAIGDRPPMALIRALEADLEGSPEPGALA